MFQTFQTKKNFGRHFLVVKIFLNDSNIYSAFSSYFVRTRVSDFVDVKQNNVEQRYKKRHTNVHTIWLVSLFLDSPCLLSLYRRLTFRCTSQRQTFYCLLLYYSRFHCFFDDFQLVLKLDLLVILTIQIHNTLILLNNALNPRFPWLFVLVFSTLNFMICFILFRVKMELVYYTRYEVLFLTNFKKIYKKHTQNSQKNS